MKSSTAVASLFSILVVGACSAKTSLPAPAAVAADPVGVRVVTPEAKLTADVLQATGSVYSRQEATISAQTGGVMSQMSVRVGDRVRKGQVLARLDPINANIAVAQATAAKDAADAARDGARTDVERVRILAKGGSVANATLERAETGIRQAEAQAQQAEAALKNAQKVLRDTAIIAPFDGAITSRSKNVGDYITSGTAIFTLVDTDSLEVRAQVPESLVDRIATGSALKGTLTASGAEFEVKVKSLGATVDLQSRTVLVVADVVPSREGAPVRPGALVQLDLSSAAQSAVASNGHNLYLPAQAVGSDGPDEYVWVVQDSKAARRHVSVAQVLPGVVRVERGLEPDALVVANASLRLQDGAALKVIR